jgi:single-strand DNA-binding protein
MDGLNRVMLLGNLGADPELRMTGGGQAVLKMRLATTESYLDRDKQRQERTEWHSVVVWGKRAEGLAKIVKKGDRLFIEGGLRTDSYEKDGEKRYRTEVVARDVILNGQAVPGRGVTRERTARNDDAEPAGGGLGAGPSYGDDDDIPF